MTTQALQDKKTQLVEILQSMTPIAVAYSGGVDSTLLLKVAIEAIGVDKVVAIMAFGPMVPASEKEAALAYAKDMGIEPTTFDADVMSVHEFVENGPKRCYYCKHFLFSKIVDLAKQHGCKTIVDGTNADDAKDYRPGRQALEELQIASPFLEVGLTKEEIRLLSKEYGLDTASKPAMACLATRIPTNTPITLEALKMVEQGEELLKEVGLSQYRLRLLGSTGRIECPPEEKHLVEEHYEELKNKMKLFGITNLEIDPDGYVCGRMNQEVTK